MDIVFIVIVGLSIGSFLNVCIYRIPRSISVVAKRSFCTSCNKQLKWFELIPVLSYILQSGKCRSCKTKISIQNPFVEILSAIIFLSLYNQFGFSLEYIEYLIYFQVALVIAFVDWKHLIIPNNVLFVGFALILGIRLFDNSSLVLDQILFGLTSFIFVLLIMFLGNYFLKRESMGMGDVKLSGFIGFVLGLPLFLVALWIASVFGSFYGIVNKIQGKQSTKIPFGAILISVSVVEMLYRKHIEEFFNTWIS